MDQRQTQLDSRNTMFRYLDFLHNDCVMSISVEETEVLSLGNKQAHISIDVHHLKNVDEFCYLGSVFHKSRMCEELKIELLKPVQLAFSCWWKQVFFKIV